MADLSEDASPSNFGVLNPMIRWDGTGIDPIRHNQGVLTITKKCPGFQRVLRKSAIKPDGEKKPRLGFFLVGRLNIL